MTTATSLENCGRPLAKASGPSPALKLDNKGLIMNKERLLRLASRMDKVKDEHFNIEWWYSPADDYEELAKTAQFREDGMLARENACGSVACVLGHAALISDFIEQGLGYIPTYEQYGGPDSPRILTDMKITYNGKYYEEAGKEFFGLNDDQTPMLFGLGGPYDYLYFFDITPKNVAKALREFVETDGASLDACYVAHEEDWGGLKGEDYGWSPERTQMAFDYFNANKARYGAAEEAA